MNSSDTDDPDGLLGLANRHDIGFPAVDDARLERLLQGALSSEAEADPSLLPHDAPAPPFGEADGAGEPGPWSSEGGDSSPTGASPEAQDTDPTHADGDPRLAFDASDAAEQERADDRDAGEHDEHGDDPWSAGP